MCPFTVIKQNKFIILFVSIHFFIGVLFFADSFQSRSHHYQSDELLLLYILFIVFYINLILNLISFLQIAFKVELIIINHY